jgi:hypothetical protein
LALAYIAPNFIPTKEIKKTIVRTAYERYNVALSIGSLKINLLPSVSFELKKVKFSSKKQILPFGMHIKGTAPETTITLNLMDYLSTGKITSTLTLEKPNIHLTQTNENRQPASSTQVDPKNKDLEKTALRLLLHEGTIRLQTDTKDIKFKLKKFEVNTPKLSELLTVQAWMELPKTKLKSGAEAQVHARVTSSIQWQLPWKDGSFLNVKVLKIDITQLNYVSDTYRIQQKRTQPIFIDLKNLEIHPNKLNEIKTIVFKLNDHVLKASGKFTFDPLRFEGAIKPFSTSVAKFPFRILQDMFPGASGELLFQNPIEISYIGQTDPQSSPVIKIELNEMKASNIQLPLPWLLLEQPTATYSGQWQIIPANSQLASTQIKMISNRIQFPKIQLKWDGTYNPKAQKGELSFLPSKLDLPKVSEWTKAIFDLNPKTGHVRVPSRLRVKFQKNGLQWTSAVNGRFIVSNLSGSWKNKYVLENISGTFLLSEKKHAIHCKLDRIIPIDTHTKDAAKFDIQNLNITAESEHQKPWDFKTLNFSINNGQVKVDNMRWDPITKLAALGHVLVFHNNLSSFLASFGGDWGETLQGKVRINGKNISLPIESLERPDWQHMKGKLDVNFISISWIALPLQGAFSKFFKSYLEKYRVNELVEEKKLSEYEHTINTSFTKGSMQLVMENEEVAIHNLSLESPEAAIKAHGLASNLKSLKELILTLNGTFFYANPPFLYGKLRQVMLEPSQKIELPFMLKGSLTIPQVVFDEDVMFKRFNDRLKALK